MGPSTSSGTRLEFLLEAHEKYGDVFVTRVLTGQSYFIRDPDVVNAINVTHAKHIYKPKVVKQMWKPFLGNGLVPNDGESWKRQHKLLLPGFHKLRIDAYAPTMADYTADMVRGWKEGEQLDFRDEMVELTLRVVAKTLFDTDLAHDSDDHPRRDGRHRRGVDRPRTDSDSRRRGGGRRKRNRRMVRALDCDGWRHRAPGGSASTEKIRTAAT